MTIAVCCVSPEGIVFGADSTTSMMVPEGFHYLNHNQKIFEIGPRSSMAAVTWGLASLGALSHRTQLAVLVDKLQKDGVTGVSDAAQSWTDQFWPKYQAQIAPSLPGLQSLHAKQPFSATAAPTPGMRTLDEEKSYQQAKLGLLVGFCIGGYDPVDRLPCAFEIKFDPLGACPGNG